MTPTERKVLAAAMAFWRMHKPIDWTPAQHIECPIVNMTATQKHVNLARACAADAAARKKARKNGHS